MDKRSKKFGRCSALLAFALITALFTTIALPKPASAQDGDRDDPPSRVARLGYLKGPYPSNPPAKTIGSAPFPTVP